MIEYGMTNHIDAAVTALSNPILAATASFASTVGLAANALPVPEGIPAWVPYLVSVCGPVLMAIGIRVLNAVAARKRALAAAKESRARALRTDEDHENDREAEVLEDEAAVLKADADALEAIRARK